MQSTLIPAFSSVVAQGLNSGSNALLAIFVARAAGLDELGDFAVIMVAYSLAVVLMRAAAGTRLLLIAESPADSRARESELGGAAIIASMCATAVALPILVAAGVSGSVIAVFGVVLPAVLLQDFVRSVFFSREQPHYAAADDAVWLGLQLILMTLTPWALGGHSLVLAVGTWGLAGTVAMLVGSASLRLTPKLGLGLTFLRRSVGATVRLVVDFTAPMVGMVALVIGVSTFASAELLAPLRAGQTALAPISMLVYGLNPVLVIKARNSVQQGLPRMFRQLGVIVAVLAVSIISATAALSQYGVLLGNLLVGANWQIAATSLLPLAFELAGATVATGAVAGLRRCGEDRKISRLRLGAVLPLILPAAVVLIGEATVQEGLWTLAAVQWAIAVVAWVFVLQRLGK